MRLQKLTLVQAQDEPRGRLSIAECRDLLGEEGRAMSDDEIEALRDSAETMAHLLIEIFLETRRGAHRT